MSARFAAVADAIKSAVTDNAMKQPGAEPFAARKIEFSISGVQIAAHEITY